MNVNEAKGEYKKRSKNSRPTRKKNLEYVFKISTNKSDVASSTINQDQSSKGENVPANCNNAQ